MKKILTLLIISITIWSCQTPEIIIEPEETLSTEYWTSSSEINEALYEAAKVLSIITNDPDVRTEIISYNSKATDGEVYVNFKELFNPTYQTRVTGSFAKKFAEAQNTISNGRTSGDISDSLALFLEQNNFAIYAPYLAENFSESDEIMTVSWWDGIDTTGVTPGILDANIGGRTSGLQAVNDDYAAINPTLVIVPDDGTSCGGIMTKCADTGGDDGTGGDTGGDIPYTPTNIDCKKLNDTDIVIMSMPYFRLMDNLRPWPNKNILSLSTVVGTFSYDANGIPSAKTPFVDQLWVKDKQVSRKHADNQTWLSSGLSNIKSNWDQPELDLRIAVAYNKILTKAKFSGSVGIDSDNNFIPDLSGDYSFEIGGTRALFDVGFDRCAFLASNADDLGFGLIDGLSINSFGGAGPMQFVLKPVFKK